MKKGATDYNGTQGNFWGYGYAIVLGLAVVSQVYTYAKTHSVVYFKYM